jgi:two-component system sensor kinase FixL
MPDTPTHSPAPQPHMSTSSTQQNLAFARQITQVSRLASMGEMAAGIAHELNQPLSAIANYAQACEHLLAQPSPHLDEVRLALRQIAEQALRAGDVIRRLRQLVRTLEPRPQATDVEASIRELWNLLQSDARLHDVELELKPAGDLPPALADSVQIQQVVLNLVHNAIEALASRTGGQRAVTVHTSHPAEDQIRISVIDTGPGVDAFIREQMFEPFCTTKENGTGLGLTVSRSIVEAHRGRLEYQPNLPTGACFCFTLPPAPRNSAS